MRILYLKVAHKFGLGALDQYIHKCYNSLASSRPILACADLRSIRHIPFPSYLALRDYASSKTSAAQDVRAKDENILSLQVNLISENGEKKGIFPLSRVLGDMDRKEFVLVQVSEDEPPFCKIYSKKSLYEKSKADVKKKFKSAISNKIFKIASNISPHDLQVKVNQCIKKLEKGDIIKFILTVPRNTPPEKIESLVFPIYEEVYEKLEGLGKISEAFTVKEGSGSFTLRGDKKVA